MEPSVPILHVEDDPIDAMNLRRAFGRCGIQNPLYVVPDGEEALAYLRREGKFADPARAPRPGLILLDLSMPRMNGQELLAALRDDPDLSPIPTVVLTASNQGPERRLAYELGACGYIVKPLEFGRFVEAVSTIEQYWSLCELP